jgi:hypothetical protein
MGKQNQNCVYYSKQTKEQKLEEIDECIDYHKDMLEKRKRQRNEKLIFRNLIILEALKDLRKKVKGGK